jgi:hypothetical protein
MRHGDPLTRRGAWAFVGSAVVLENSTPGDLQCVSKVPRNAIERCCDGSVRNLQFLERHAVELLRQCSNCAVSARSHLREDACHRNPDVTPGIRWTGEHLLIRGFLTAQVDPSEHHGLPMLSAPSSWAMIV